LPDAAGPGPGLGGLALLAVALVLAGTAGVRVAALDDGLLPQLAARGGQAVVSVVVAQEPRPTAQGWHLDVRALAVDGEATREGAAIRLDADTTPPGLGERWEVLATARPPPDDGYGRWLARRHARVLLDPVRIEHAGEAGPLARSSEHVRARIRTAATARTPDDVGGLLVGLVTGDTRLLSDDAQQAMRDTSLTHLTAVSGTHVAVLVAGVLGLCTLLRLGAVGRRRAVAVSLLGFAYLTRFEPSVLRAGTMAAVLLLAFARGVPRDARHALAGAVLLLVLVDPLLASTLGLLLSATATAGVLVIAPRVSERLARLRRLPSRVGDLLGVTVGAQVAVLPLLLATFGEVPLASVPANLLAVPPGAAAAGLGFLAAAVSVVHTGAGEVLFLVAGVPARLVLLASERLAGLGGAVEVDRPLAVVGLVSVGVWLCTRAGARTARVTAAVAAVAVTVAAMAPLLPRAPVTTLAVTAIDVGQGDAFLVESPGARVLVDAGEDDTAARWLRRSGPDRIDLAIVTHPHLDHVGGMADVLRAVDVGQVWYRPMPNDLDAVDDLLAEAAAGGIEVRAPVAGEHARVGDLHLEVLSPPPGRPYRFSGSELNDSSIVVRVRWSDRRLLLTGDIEHAAQRDLLEHPERLRAEAFTVPHHGAATSEEAFLRAVGARVGLIGVGQDNRHGHPHPDVLELLASEGVRVVRTDEHGTTRVEVPAPSEVVSHPRIGSSYGSRPPPRRRRRPPPAPRGGPRPRRAPRAGPGAHRGDPRRHRDRAPARAAHPVAVRRPAVRGPARRRGRQRRPQGGAGVLPRAALAGRGARAGRARDRPDPEDRPARQGARRAHRREDPADWDERGWDRIVGEEFRRAGRKADAAAIAAIRAHAGTDASVVASKVAQVCASAEAGTITAEQVEAVVEGHGRQSGFAIADAVAERDPAAALIALRGALESGEAPLAILGALAFRFRQLLRVRAGAAPKEAGVSPGQHRRLKALAGGFGPVSWRGATTDLAQLDVDLKGSELPDHLLIELAVVEVATPREVGAPFNPMASR
jgi:competence protein ComEC